MAQVRVATFDGPGAPPVIRIVERPAIPKNAALMQVGACGVCGTDIHAYTSGRNYTPAICGHEWTGKVSAAGRAVTRVSEGDRVVVAREERPMSLVRLPGQTFFKTMRRKLNWATRPPERA